MIVHRCRREWYWGMDWPSLVALPQAVFEHECFLTFALIGLCMWDLGVKVLFLISMGYINNPISTKGLFEGSGSLTVSDWQW